MNRIERMQEKNLTWLRKTGFTFGKLRAGGSQVPQSAIDHMRRKPYTTNGIVREVKAANE